MKIKFIAALLVLVSCTAQAQAPIELAKSHADTRPPSLLKVTGRSVAKVNGVALTDRDLLRQMYALFPYAQQHQGFPRAMEADIRRAALEIIIFEELVYQEAQRRKMTVPAAQVRKAQTDLEAEFSSPEEYRQFLQAEVQGSQQKLREKIRRALLIDKFLNAEVAAKSKVTAAEARAYFDGNPKLFEQPETFHIQSISILPPNNSPAIVTEARKRAEEAAQAAKDAGSYQDFGLLAEKISDDDFRVNMGDHKPRRPEELPPPVVAAARSMQPGQVSELIQLGNAFTIFRLVAHTPAGKSGFAEVKAKLMKDLQKQKAEELRSALGQKLRKNASIERL